MKKFFQANVVCQLNYTGTEFSTSGANSKYLEEYALEDQHSLLGTGGYAEVRKAIHKKSGYHVAFKIYDKYKLIDVQIKQNLVREIRILARLSQGSTHSHLLRLYESIDTFSHVYLITEFISGVPL